MAKQNQIDTVIDGKSIKTWNRDGFSVSIAEEPLKFFVALTTSEGPIDYYLHFENESDVDYTEAEKEALFTGLDAVIEKGEIVSTSGGVTPGGISALKKLQKYGYKIIAQTSDERKVYWASDRLLDKEKFEKWLNKEGNNDFKVKDASQPLSKENTKPIVPVLKKQ